MIAIKLGKKRGNGINREGLIKYYIKREGIIKDYTSISLFFL